MDQETHGAVYYAIYVALWLFQGYLVSQIADKAGEENTWRAYVPVLNIFMLLDISARPWWWFLLLFIPFVNLIIIALIWMGICERRGKPGIFGLLFFVPVANLVLLIWLAFSSETPAPERDMPPVGVVHRASIVHPAPGADHFAHRPEPHARDAAHGHSHGTEPHSHGAPSASLPMKCPNCHKTFAKGTATCPSCHVGLYEDN